MLPVELTLPFATAFGLIIGSYLNVVIYRLPRGLSTVQPASRCPRCVMPIRPFDNVPVVGYLWLLARCRDCGLPISPRYPLVELATGVYFAWIHLQAESGLEQVAASLFGALLLVLAMIDFDHQQVPVLPVVIASVLGVSLQPWLGWAHWQAPEPGSAAFSALVAAVLGILAARLVAAVARRVGVEHGLGWGDALVLGLIGAALGARGLAVAFLLAAALVVLCYTPRLLISRRSWDEPIPFVTFLALGALVVLLVGPLAAGS